MQGTLSNDPHPHMAALCGRLIIKTLDATSSTRGYGKQVIINNSNISYEWTRGEL